MATIDYQSSPPPSKPIARWRIVREKTGEAAFFCFVCNGIAAVSALIVCGIDVFVPYRRPFGSWDLVDGGFFYLGMWGIGVIGILVSFLQIFSRKALWALLAIVLGVAIILVGWKMNVLTAPHIGRTAPGVLL